MCVIGITIPIVLILPITVVIIASVVTIVTVVGVVTIVATIIQPIMIEKWISVSHVCLISSMLLSTSLSLIKNVLDDMFEIDTIVGCMISSSVILTKINVFPIVRFYLRFVITSGSKGDLIVSHQIP